MTKVYKILILLLAYFLFPCNSNAQENNLRIRHLTTENGLSQNRILDILQDNRGFMWFATMDGLNRYDGYTFDVYKNDPDDSTTISSNFIIDLFEDDQGQLWIATNGGGINKFNPSTGHTTRYQYNPNNPNSLSDITVESIIQDSDGFLWFATPNKGLNKFDPATETFTRFLTDTDGRPFGRITSVAEDMQKNIWFVGEHGLYSIEPQTHKVSHSKLTLDRLSADYLYPDTLGNLWILSWDPASLIKYSPGTKQLSIYPNSDIGLFGCNLFEDKKNGFWIPSKNGLYYFNRQTEQFTHIFQSDRTNPEGLNDNNVSSIYQDKAGLLWLGTDNGGINLVNFQQEYFGLEQYMPGNSNSILPNKLGAIHIDFDGILWLGYAPRALSRFDRNTGQITHYLPNPKNKNSLGSGLNITCIYKDTRGRVWIGGWEGGLVRFDERTGHFKQYLSDPKNPNSLISNNLLSIYEDREGILWLGQHGGLSRFNPETEQFTHFLPDPDNPTKLGGASVRCIYQDNDGLLWLGTWQGVLSRFDITINNFVNYKPDPYSPQALHGGSLQAIHEDTSGSLWLASSDGVYQFIRKNESFILFTEKQGLPSNNIQGILGDDAGHLWISTKKGLSRFDPRTGIFKNYDKSDGLQSNDFSEACFDKSIEGELFFGGSHGFNAFFSDSIQDDPVIPPIVLTDFRLFGKTVPVGEGSLLQKTINETKSLTLQYNQNSLTFEFSALSYAAPEKNQYSYKLEGFDTDWHKGGSNERLAVYTNLGADNYIFRVKGTNEDGVWNEKGAAINITITPPWWQTWWLRSLGILLLISMIYAGFLFRVRTIKKHNLRLESEVIERTRQLQVANNELEAFSYSVSHDLRAPLRSIDGFSQVLLEEYQEKIDEQGKNYLQRVRKASQRMAQLIDDMLTLSKVSRIEMNFRQVNLSKMVQDIAGELRENQPEREVEFIIQQGIKVKGDAVLLRTVLENLLGNAWKFTLKHPTARIEFGMQLQNELPVYFIRDNGAGFNMEYAQKLFGAFQRLHANTEFPGTGVGLATAQRVIKRHGGKVWAEGEVEKGATFYFTIAQ